LAFGGSSTSFTLPHTHNQTLANDGGTLSTTLTDMGAVTLFSLITGATDPQTAINTAAIATNTAAIAAIPPSAWTRIINQTQAGGSANFNVTGLTSTAKFLMFNFAGSFGGNDQLRMRFGSGGSIDTGANYRYTLAAAGESSILLNTTNFEGDRDFFVNGFMQYNASTDGTGTADTRIGNIIISGLANGWETFTVGYEWFESATPITDIRFYASGGNDISGTVNIWESQ